MSKTPSRRERRRAELREDLLRSARAELAVRGAGGLRVVDVVQRADVGMSAFYGQFASKSDLVREVVSDIASGIAEAVGREIESLRDPAEALSVWARALIDACRTDPELVEALLGLDDAETRFEAIVRPLAEAVVARGLDEGRFDVERPELATGMIIAGVLIAVRMASAGTLDVQDAGRGAAEAALRSLGVDRGDAHEVARRPFAASS